MRYRTSLDREISIFKEYIKRWEKIATVLAKISDKGEIAQMEKSRYDEDIDWCSKNYFAIQNAEHNMQIVHPQTGVKASYPVIWTLLSKFQGLGTPTNKDIQNLKSGYLSLKAHLGFLENEKDSRGEIKIEEYEKLRSLIERLRLEHSSVDSLLKLAESCDFLALDFNWMISTISLQLQEVAMTLVASRLGIKLDKSNVSRILGKRFEKGVAFKDRYFAFCKEIKRLKDITLSQLPTDLRGMRTRVLHEGTSPNTSEAKLLTNFTCAFLDDLSSALQ